jgi:uncharacterized membrane protein YsdA (DUF1294 family)
MKSTNVKMRPEIKSAIKKQHRKIVENKLLFFGALIGITGSLIAGVINDLIEKNTFFYPWKYLIILIVIFIILLFFLIKPYLEWENLLYKINEKMKETRKVLDEVERHYTKYPKNRNK